jgi:hypothetical protein
MDSETLNQGGEPTLFTKRRQEITDLTVCSRELVSEVHGWTVSPEQSLSDYRHILFSLMGQQEKKANYRNPQTTCCASYWEELRDKFHGFPSLCYTGGH